MEFELDGRQWRYHLAVLLPNMLTLLELGAVLLLIRRISHRTQDH
jgi:hypothetical protein